MTIIDLAERLKDIGIPEMDYYLHGIYGSRDDNEKHSLTIKKGKYSSEYEVYFKEKGEKCSIETFLNEDKACRVLYERLIFDWLYSKMNEVDGIQGMTVNERLFASGLMDIFDQYKYSDKIIARVILQMLRVDNNSIEMIVG